MKRAIGAVAATIVGLVMLLSFKSHPVAGVKTVSGDDPLSTLPDVTASGAASPDADGVSSGKPAASGSPDPSATTEPTPTPSVDPVTGITTTPTPTATATSKPGSAGSVTTKPTSKPTTAPTTKPTATSTPKPTATPTQQPGNGTFNGSIVKTGYGDLQVQITVSGGRITNVAMLRVPDQDDMDREINDYAVPQLISQTIDRQSANVDTVSGATYTSNGYRQSTQAAINAAGL